MYDEESIYTISAGSMQATRGARSRSFVSCPRLVVYCVSRGAYAGTSCEGCYSQGTESLDLDLGLSRSLSRPVACPLAPLGLTRPHGDRSRPSMAALASALTDAYPIQQQGGPCPPCDRSRALISSVLATATGVLPPLVLASTAAPLDSSSPATSLWLFKAA